MNKSTKIIILVLVVIGILILSGKAFALATYKLAENVDFTILQNNSTDLDNVKVSKFVDGKNTCYLATSKVTGGYTQLPTAVSISCIK